MKDGWGIEVAWADLQTPPFVGFADSCRAWERGSYLDIELYDSALGSALSRFVFDRGSTIEAIARSHRDFLGTTTKWLEANGVSPRLVTIERERRPEAPASPVNFLRCGRAGREAEIEFYYGSIGAIGRAIQGGASATIAIDGVARIYTPLETMVGLLKYLLDFAQNTEEE